MSIKSRRQRRRRRFFPRALAALIRMPKLKVFSGMYADHVRERATLIEEDLPEAIVKAASPQAALNSAIALVEISGLRTRKKLSPMISLKLWEEWSRRPTRPPRTRVILLPSKWGKASTRYKVRTLLHERHHFLQERSDKGYRNFASQHSSKSPTDLYILMYLEEEYRWMFEMQCFGLEIRCMALCSVLAYSDEDIRRRIERIAATLKANYRLSASQEYIEHATRKALIAHWDAVTT